MKRAGYSRLRIFVPSVVMGMFAGCAADGESDKKIPLGVDPSMGAFANSAAYRDTIGAYATFEGLTPMRVRGYGLVVGLGKSGSRDCPPNVYKRLVQHLHKRHRFSSTLIGVRTVSPEALIGRLDTAVVLVQAEIPPAAVRGERFDVTVSVLPGTQTKSLRGGRLFATDLEMYRQVSAAAILTGQTLAHAAGPVFLNPFSDEDSATQTNPLQGLVIGGGVATVDRRVRLVLTEPSYRRVRQIQDRINAHFPAARKVADAVSPSFVRLTIPEEYHTHTGHFLALARSLYLSRDPARSAMNARALAAELTDPTAPHAQIALALEGLGQAALSVIDPLYAHQSESVSFHACVAGLRLGDHIASDTMALHAGDPTCPHRFQAIRALAEAEGMAGAAMSLRRLLHDEDPRIQVAAYEGLVERGDPTIDSTLLGGDNFRLDRIVTERSNLVYVKRGASRRIALFGKDLRCSPPVLYRSSDGGVTINANPGDEHLTLLRMVVASGSMSPPVPVPFELPALIELMGREAEIGHDGEILGLGVDYGGVVRALYHLCRDQSVNAKFVLEQPNVADLFGPPRPTGRPESDL